MVSFEIFFSDPKMSISPIKFSLLDWRKIQTILEKRYKKNQWFTRIIISVEKKTGCAYEEESDKYLEN